MTERETAGNGERSVSARGAWVAAILVIVIVRAPGGGSVRGTDRGKKAASGVGRVLKMTGNS